MVQALKDQAQAEPWKSSSSQAQAQALKGLFFSLHKNSNFLGPSQKVKIKPGSSLGPSQNFEPKPKKKTGTGLSPSRALDPLLHRISNSSTMRSAYAANELSSGLKFQKKC